MESNFFLISTNGYKILFCFNTPDLKAVKIVLNGLKTTSNTYGDEILTITKNRSTAPAATWKDEEEITYLTDKSWQSEADEFISSIKKQRKVNIGSSADAPKLMKIIDQIYTFRRKEE